MIVSQGKVHSEAFQYFAVTQKLQLVSNTAWYPAQVLVRD